MQLKMMSKRTHEAYNGNCLLFPNFQVFDYTIIEVPCISFSAMYDFLGFEYFRGKKVKANSNYLKL